jgi:hypothetical protein
MEFLRELARTRDIDPDKFFMTDDEIQQQAMAMQAQMEQQAILQGGPVGAPGEAGPAEGMQGVVQ